MHSPMPRWIERTDRSEGSNALSWDPSKDSFFRGPRMTQRVRLSILVSLFAYGALSVAACDQSEPRPSSDAGGVDADARVDIIEDAGEDVTPREDLEVMRIDEMRRLEAIVALQKGEQTTERYRIADVVVSSPKPAEGPVQGAYVQDSSGQLTRSGLYLSLADSDVLPPPNFGHGTLVEAVGRIRNDAGMIEMFDVSYFATSGHNEPVTMQIMSNEQLLKAGGFGGNLNAGTLVAVENQTVASWDPEANGGVAEFESGILIGTDLYDFTQEYPDVKPGDTFARIIGPLEYEEGKRRILPRSEFDLLGLER